MNDGRRRGADELRRSGAKALMLVGLLAIAQAGVIVVHLLWGAKLTGAQVFVDRMFLIGSSIAILVATVLNYRLIVVPSAERTAQAFEKHRALFAFNSDPVFFYDCDATLLEANLAAVALFGDAATRPGVNLERGPLGLNADALRERFADACKGASYRCEISGTDFAGKPLSLLLTLQPVIVAGAVSGLYAIAKNITDIRDAEAALEFSERQFRSIFDYHRDGAACYGPDRRILRVNAAAERILGYEQEEIAGRLGVDFTVDERQRAASAAALDRVYAGESFEWTSNARRKDGTSIVTSVFGVPMIVSGRVVGAFTFFKDITEQRRLEAQLARHEERLRALYLVASSAEPDPETQISEALRLGAEAFGVKYAFFSLVVDGQIVVRNALTDYAEFRVGFSMPLERAIARHFYGSKRALAVEDVTQQPWIEEALSRKLPWAGFIGTSVFANGEACGILTFMDTVSHADRFTQTDIDFIDLMSILIGSILEREERDRTLRQMAFNDVLTGLANRALLEEHVHLAIAQARRTQRRIALHFIDLDGFKDVNDTYGHAAGDHVLREIARRFRSTVRDEDVVARVGGDEFVVLQPDVTDLALAHRLAGRLADALAEPVVLPGGVSIVAKASSGMALYPEDAVDVHDLLARADARMYSEKLAKPRPVSLTGRAPGPNGG